MAIHKDLNSVVVAQTYACYPFDMRWSLVHNIGSAASDLKKKDVDGSGIYFVSYQNKAVFVGKFNGRNILEQRLFRLLYRLTLRGIHTGFGKCDESKANAIIELLPESLKPYVDYLKLANLTDKPFKDTGAVVTRSDIAFANTHWTSHFEHADESNILEGFAFTYYKVDNEQCIKYLESEITQKYQLPAMKSVPGASQILSIDMIDAAVQSIAKSINSSEVNKNRCRPYLTLSLQ